MEVMFWIWLGIITVSLIVEIITLDLVSIWFATGGVIPFIMSAIGGVHFAIQIAVFVVVSAVLIIFVRKLAQKLLFKGMNEKTNVQANEGKRVRLLEDADQDKNGSIKINDIVWTAVSETGEKIKKGTLVEITKIEGNKMLVKAVKETSKKQKEQEIEEVIQENN